MRQALADPGLDASDRELLLSDRFLAYAAILARGQISPNSYWSDWALPSQRFDPVAAAASLASAGGPAAALQSLRPGSADYAGLQQALARYAGAQAAGGWPVLAATHLKPGASGQAVIDLRWRLAAEGYLTPGQAVSAAFDIELASAVMLFQRRHGLADDGAVGPLTLAALNVGAAERAGQIRLNLERWREMPRLWPATRIEVNVPAQTLTYYRGGSVALSSRVIVGDPKHHTPVLAAAVERVILDPAWNIPASIIANEIQPRLARDPGYLARTHTIILGRGAGDPYGRDVDWRHTRVLAMGWRLRQLPGAWNSLGSVVLDMPSPFDVYLHDTPVRSLFAQSQRALSHGCIRVEQVRALAALLLGLPELPPAGGETRAIELTAPVAVYLLYQTAFIDQEGAVEFRDDIYGRDEKLAELLAPAGASEPATGPTADTGCHRAIAGLASLNP
jgi:murein L,D-transpeptidase YcbB/YkuD